MSRELDQLAAQWARLGAGFDSDAAAESPDVERLLLETARRLGSMPRLLTAAATWLSRYGELVARNRLKRLARSELEREHRAALGLLLEIAQRGRHPARFAAVIGALRGEAMHPARPLFDVERASAGLAERAERRASAVSRRWGLWCEEIELKTDALRPAAWVMARNPELVMRADFRGDLRASIVAALRHDADAGRSELALARSSGGSRAQVRNSLENLEMTGRVRRAADGRRAGVVLQYAG